MRLVPCVINVGVVEGVLALYDRLLGYSRVIAGHRVRLGACIMWLYALLDMNFGMCLAMSVAPLGRRGVILCASTV